MNDISGRIGLYHNLFLNCLVLALICLVLAVVLFFVLDIRSTLGYLTGRRAKKKIEELEEATEQAVNMMNTNDSTAVLEAGARPKGKFLIVRELMLIHTEEVI